MKTNQVLIRKMGEFNISQRTIDEMFNATELVKNWNEHVSTIDKNDNTQKNGYLKKKKDLDDFFGNKQTKEFINVLSQKENNVFTKTRGKNGGTWMHPYLFIDFAMWLNPEFKYEVLKFVHDQLIKNRHEAGDGHKILASQVGKIVNKQFMKVAMTNISTGINHIIYGRHERNIRNKEATETYLTALRDLQKKVTMLIDEGFLRSYEDVLKYLRLTWQKENQPKIFDN